MGLFSVIRKSWLVNSSRIYLRRFNEEFGRTLTPDMLVLDAGAGEAPYYDIFSKAQYESADLEQGTKDYRPSTYVCDLVSIPVEDARFDRVVFNQVLEHLPRPLVVLRELNRVMKPDGRIICSCPLFYEEHEQPNDFYRYTQFAHRYLFEQAGFEVEQLDWLEGYFGTLAYQLEGAYKFLPASPKKLGGGLVGWLLLPLILLCKLIAFFLAGIFYRLDLAVKLTNTGLPKNYVVVARKIGQPKSEDSTRSPVPATT